MVKEFIYTFSQSLYGLPFRGLLSAANREFTGWLKDKSLTACTKTIACGNFRTQRECST